eukprot:6395582-Prymnesium_polylepis.1
MLDDEAQAQLIGEQMAALGPAQTAASMKFASKMMADGKGVSPAEVLQRVLAEAAANGIEGLTGPLKSMFGELSDEDRLFLLQGLLSNENFGSIEERQKLLYTLLGSSASSDIMSMFQQLLEDGERGTEFAIGMEEMLGDFKQRYKKKQSRAKPVFQRGGGGDDPFRRRTSQKPLGEMLRNKSIVRGKGDDGIQVGRQRRGGVGNAHGEAAHGKGIP